MIVQDSCSLFLIQRKKKKMYKPHKAQLSFHNDRFRHRHRALLAGTGSGKSYAGCQEAIALALSMCGSVGLICAPTYKKLIEVIIPVLRDILGEDFNRIIVKFDRQKMFLDFYNGSRVWLIGLDKPEATEGITASWAWIDEARLVPKLQEAMDSGVGLQAVQVIPTGP